MVKAIVGANWGDEGKGKVTDMLAEKADVIIRYQGGFNVKETAAILGMSSTTVTAHKKRIVEIIKKFFEGANFSG